MRVSTKIQRGTEIQSDRSMSRCAGVPLNEVSQQNLVTRRRKKKKLTKFNLCFVTDKLQGGLEYIIYNN